MAIRAEHLNFLYGEGTVYEQYALKDVNFEIEDGQFIGLIGHTGSGKSTLIQHLNGLLRASSGALYYNGENIYQDGYDMKKLRSKVGLVFQYPDQWFPDPARLKLPDWFPFRTGHLHMPEDGYCLQKFWPDL